MYKKDKDQKVKIFLLDFKFLKVNLSYLLGTFDAISAGELISFLLSACLPCFLLNACIDKNARLSFFYNEKMGSVSSSKRWQPRIELLSGQFRIISLNGRRCLSWISGYFSDYCKQLIIDQSGLIFSQRTRKQSSKLIELGCNISSPAGC